MFPAQLDPNDNDSCEDSNKNPCADTPYCSNAELNCHCNLLINVTESRATSTIAGRDDVVGNTNRVKR